MPTRSYRLPQQVDVWVAIWDVWSRHLDGGRGTLQLRPCYLVDSDEGFVYICRRRAGPIHSIPVRAIPMARQHFNALIHSGRCRELEVYPAVILRGGS
jgi:hypothetical protein